MSALCSTKMTGQGGLHHNVMGKTTDPKDLIGDRPSNQNYGWPAFRGSCTLLEVLQYSISERGNMDKIFNHTSSLSCNIYCDIISSTEKEFVHKITRLVSDLNLEYGTFFI